MKRTLGFACALLALLVLSVSAVAQLPITAGATWQEFAAKHLTKGGKSFTVEEFDKFAADRVEGMRCVKMNNYVCMVQMGSANSWKGSDGQKDQNGHAVFSDPVFSIRAIVRDWCSKSKRDVRSATKIAETYSPWCDTLGSVGVRRGWGRSCNDGGERPPEGFSGPVCQRPASGAPSGEQCGACNCPSGIEKAIVRGLMKPDGTPFRVDEDLPLFDGQGKPDSILMPIAVRNMVRQETGFTVSDDLLVRGIEAAGVCQ